jgi:hypothetical protein
MFRHDQQCRVLSDLACLTDTLSITPRLKWYAVSRSGPTSFLPNPFPDLILSIWELKHLLSFTLIVHFTNAIQARHVRLYCRVTVQGAMIVRMLTS